MKNVFITILVILVIGLGGYLVYDKIKDKDVKGESNNNIENVKQYDLVEAKKLVDKYTDANNFLFSSSIFENKMTEQDKIYLAIKYTNPSNINYTCSEAFPNGKNEYNSIVIEDGAFYGVCSDEFDYDAYTYDSVNKSYKELFGSDQELPKKLVSSVWSRYAYSEKYNAYIELSCECGGAPYVSSYYDVGSATEKDDTLEVIVNYISFNFTEFNTKFYVEQNYDINIIINDPHNLEDAQIKDLYNRALNQNSVLKYKFTFKKNNTGYYLESIVKQVY